MPRNLYTHTSHTQRDIIDSKNQIMLELRLIFYSILMRQTKADKQTPTPPKQLRDWHTHTPLHTHTHSHTHSVFIHVPPPLALCLMSRWRCIGWWPYIPSYRVLQIKAHNTWPWPRLLRIAGWGEITTAMGHGGVSLD